MLISWYCAQKRTALSSSEAEYIGLSESSKEILYLKQLLPSIDTEFNAVEICLSGCLNPFRCVLHTQIIWDWSQIYVKTPNIEEVMPY